jgi:hypothetical protein
MGTLSAKIGLSGRKNTAGNLPVLLIADVSDFETIEQPAADSVEIDADHVFKTGEGFSELEASYSSVTEESAGSEEPDSTGERSVLSAFLPGEESDLQSEVLKMKAGRFIILKKHRDKADTHVQYGSSTHEYAILKSYKFMNSEFLGKKGFELVFHAEVASKLFYKGAVVLKEAEVIGG